MEPRYYWRRKDNPAAMSGPSTIAEIHRERGTRAAARDLEVLPAARQSYKALLASTSWTTLPDDGAADAGVGTTSTVTAVAESDFPSDGSAMAFFVALALALWGGGSMIMWTLIEGMSHGSHPGTGMWHLGAKLMGAAAFLFGVVAMRGTDVPAEQRSMRVERWIGIAATLAVACTVVALMGIGEPRG